MNLMIYKLCNAQFTPATLTRLN